ncbi:MAG: TldD/PmbA family protein [archaeon]
MVANKVIKNTEDISSKLDNIKNYLVAKSLDYFDIRQETINTTSINIENKFKKNILENSRNGIGIRVLKNKKLGFCSFNYNQEDYKKIIDNTIDGLKYINKKTNLENFETNKDSVKFKYESFEDLDISKKVNELYKINLDFLEANKNERSEKILQSTIRYSEIYREKYFISPYSEIYQQMPYQIMYSIITAKKNNIIESNIARSGNIGGLEVISSSDKINLLNKNLKITKELLNSASCPAKTSDILIDPEIAGLLAHEAIGHAAEADAVINNSSVLKLNEKLSANKEVSIIDDPTIKEFGYFKYDDEGIKAKPKTIVKKGIVNTFMTDLESSFKLKLNATGSSRAEDYSVMPIVRMSNTYFEKGTIKLEEILQNFSGLFLTGFAGGETDPAVGTFMFGIKQAIEYKNGKIINRYKQASISGNINNYLNKISQVSNKLGEFDIGFCGKGGQRAFVSGGGPHLKITNATVGGTKH